MRTGAVTAAPSPERALVLVDSERQILAGVGGGGGNSAVDGAVSSVLPSHVAEVQAEPSQ